METEIQPSLEDISKKTARRIARKMHAFNTQRDVIVASKRPTDIGNRN